MDILNGLGTDFLSIKLWKKCKCKNDISVYIKHKTKKHFIGTLYITEWSKSEREKQISYNNIDMCNLEKCTDEPICRAGIEMQA